MDPSVEIVKYDEGLYDRFKKDLKRIGRDIYNEQDFKELPPELNPRLSLYPRACLYKNSKPHIAVFPLDSESSIPHLFLMENYLDLTNEYKLCIKASKVVGAAYALIFSVRRAYIYNTHTEEIILYTQSAPEFKDSVLPAISKEITDEDYFSTIITKSDEEKGRDLREWISLWSSKIKDAVNFSKEETDLFFYQLLLVSQIEKSEIAEENYLENLSDLGNVSEIENPFKFKEIFSYYSHKYNIELCRMEMRIQNSYKELAENRLLLKKLFIELNLLSSSKFNSKAYISAFGKEDLRALSWKMPISEQREFTKHFFIDNNVVYQPLILNLNEMGYECLLNQIEYIIEKTNLHNQNTKDILKSKNNFEIQFDLINPIHNSVNLNTGLIENVIEFVFNNTFKIKINNNNEKNFLKLLIYSRLIELQKSEQTNKQIKFPNLEKIFIF